MDDRLDVRPGAQHFRMNEYLVVARHRSVNLLAVEPDRDDVVRRHLFEADASGLHEKPLRVTGKAHADMAGDVIALALHGENPSGIGERVAQGIGHGRSPLGLLELIAGLAAGSIVSARPLYRPAQTSAWICSRRRTVSG